MTWTDLKTDLGGTTEAWIAKHFPPGIPIRTPTEYTVDVDPRSAAEVEADLLSAFA